MRRRSGATKWRAESTTSSSIKIVPLSGRSNPAIKRKRVVLPLPDAPSTVTTAPSGTSRSRPSRTRVFPKDFQIPLHAIRLIAPPGSSRSTPASCQHLEHRPLPRLREETTVEPPAEEIHRDDRHHHHRRGIRGRCTEGHPLLRVGP